MSKEFEQKLNEEASRVHEIHEQWWIDIETGTRVTRNKGELIALIHSELSEASEGVITRARDDHLPEFAMGEVEIADTMIRLLDYAGGFRITISERRDLLSQIHQSEFLIPSHVKQVVATISGATLMTRKLLGIEALHRMTSGLLEAARKGTIEQESAYLFAIARLLAEYSASANFNLWEIMDEKLEYNQKRADHKHEARKQPGGKRF